MSTQKDSADAQKMSFSFRSSLWACIKGATRGGWEARELRIAAVTCITPCSTREGLKVTLRRSRHGAAKGSAVAVSATELARLVCRSRTFGTVGRTSSAVLSRVVSYGDGPRWSHQHVGQNNGTGAAIHDDEKTTVSACELQSEHLSDETSETHGSETILTQRSLHNERAVAESSFDGILNVGAPCLPKPHEIVEN